MSQTKQVEIKIHDIFAECIDDAINKREDRINMRRRYARKTIKLISQAQQQAVERTLKKVYSMVMQNGSFERSQLLHKLTRIIQGEESL